MIQQRNNSKLSCIKPAGDYPVVIHCHYYRGNNHKVVLLEILNSHSFAFYSSKALMPSGAASSDF